MFFLCWTTSILAKPLRECIVIVQGPHSDHSFQHASCLLLKKNPQNECGWKRDALFVHEVWCVLILSRRSPKFMKHLYSVVPACAALLNLLPGPTCWINLELFLSVIFVLMVTGIPLRFRSFNVKVSWQAALFSVHVGKLPRLSCKVSSDKPSAIYEAWGSCANEQMRLLESRLMTN